MTFSSSSAATELHPPAPEIEAEHWINVDHPPSLRSLRGRVVVMHAFQMLCPGCVAHGLPQAKEIWRAFEPADVAVIGLHSVFEHHAVMGADALCVFAHEYRLPFPIAIDRAGVGDQWPLPCTMRAYGLQGTPSLILIDAEGRIRARHLGRSSLMVWHLLDSPSAQGRPSR